MVQGHAAVISTLVVAEQLSHLFQPITAWPLRAIDQRTCMFQQRRVTLDTPDIRWLGWAEDIVQLVLCHMQNAVEMLLDPMR
jgi:hypothetical protein